MKILSVLGLCAIGVVVAALLLWPSGDSGPKTPMPTVAGVSFDAAALKLALNNQEIELRSARNTDAIQNGRLDELLDQDPLDVNIPSVTQQGVELRDVNVHRAGQSATADALVDPEQLEQFAPSEVSDLEYDQDDSGPNSIIIHGKASALGFKVSVTIEVHAVDGKVVASPQGLPLDDIVLFDDPRIRITSVSSQADGTGKVRVSADAQLP